MADDRKVQLTFVVKADGIQVLDQAGKKITELGTEAERATKKASQGFSNLQSNIITVNQAMDLGRRVGNFLVGTYNAVTAAAIEQQNATIALEQTLRSTGQLSRGYVSELEAIASEYQRVTKFGDEAVLGVQRQLIAFGAGRDQIRELTGAVLDLSSGLGVDLRAATLLMGKAVAGEFGTLSRYGILVNENASASDKLSQALALIGERFGGQAESAARTYAGRLAQLSNVSGDLLEEIGFIIVGSDAFNAGLGRLKDRVAEVVTAVSNWRRENQDLIDQRINGVIDAIADAANELGPKLPQIAADVGALAGSMATLASTASGLVPSLHTVATALGAIGEAFDALPEPFQKALLGAAVGGALTRSPAGVVAGGFLGFTVGVGEELVESSKQITEAIGNIISAFQQADEAGPISAHGLRESVDALAELRRLLDPDAEENQAGGVPRKRPPSRGEIEAAKKAHEARLKQLAKESTLEEQLIRQRQAAEAILSQAAIARAETTVQVAERELALLTDQNASAEQRLVLAQQIDQAERVALETRLAAYQAQASAIQAAGPPTVDQLARLELMSAEVARMVALWDVTPTKVQAVSQEIRKSNTITIDAGKTLRDGVINALTAGPGGFGESLKRGAQAAMADAVGGMLEEKLKFDLEFERNFAEDLPGFIESGAGLMQSAWSSALDSLGLASEQTAGGVKQSFGRAFSDIASQSADAAQQIGGQLRNVPGVGNIANLFSGTDGRIVLVDEFGQRFSGASIGQLGGGAPGGIGTSGGGGGGGIGGGAAALGGLGGAAFGGGLLGGLGLIFGGLSGSNVNGPQVGAGVALLNAALIAGSLGALGATAGAVSLALGPATAGILTGIAAGTTGSLLSLELGRVNTSQAQSASDAALRSPIQAGLAAMFGIKNHGKLATISSLAGNAMEMGVPKLLELLGVGGITKPPMSEGLVGKQLGEIFNFLNIPLPAIAGGRRPGGPSIREFDPARIGDMAFPQVAQPASFAGINTDLTETLLARYFGPIGAMGSGNNEGFQGPTRGVLNAAAALGLAAEDAREMLRSVVHTTAGDFEEQLFALRASQRDTEFGRAGSNTLTFEQLVDSITGLIETFHDFSPAVDAAKLSLLAFNEAGELQVEAFKRQIETANRTAEGLGLQKAVTAGLLGEEFFGGTLARTARESVANILTEQIAATSGLNEPFQGFTAGVAAAGEAFRQGDFERGNAILADAARGFDLATAAASDYFATIREQSPEMVRLLDRIEFEQLGGGFEGAAKTIREQAEALRFGILKPRQQEAFLIDKLAGVDQELAALQASAGGIDTAEELQRAGELIDERRRIIEDQIRLAEARFTDGSSRERAAILAGVTELEKTATLAEDLGIYAKEQADHLSANTAAIQENTNAIIDNGDGTSSITPSGTPTPVSIDDARMVASIERSVQSTDLNTDATTALADALARVVGAAEATNPDVLSQALVPLLLMAARDPRFREEMQRQSAGV